MGLKHRNLLHTSVAFDFCLIFDLIKAGLFGYYLICLGLFYASKLPYLPVLLCMPFIVLVYFYIVLGEKKKNERKKKSFSMYFSHLVSPALFLISKMPSCQILSCQEVIQLPNHFFTSIIYFNIWKQQNCKISYSSLQQTKQNQLQQC